MKKFAITTFFFLCSCNLENSNQPKNEVDLPINDDQVKRPDKFPFPESLRIENCIEPAKAPELCEWGGAAYDIVLLKVTKTSLIVSPVIDSNTGMIVDHCDQVVEAGFRIEGMVQQSVKGLSGKITVDTGVEQSQEWSTSPWVLPSEDGTIPWSDGVGIKKGDVIGLTLHKHPINDTLGILGELFFDIEQNNTLRFGERYSECGNPPPKEAGDLTFAKLKEEIKKCSTTSKLADTRKKAKEKIWQNPAFANLGECYGK